MLLLSAGCGHPAQSGPRPFVIDQTSEPRSLDPVLDSGYTSEQIGSLVYSYLVRIDARGRLEPDLAARVPSVANGDISRDGKTIVYHLRPGVEWHDGAPFTADDVIATYRAVMDPRNPVPTRLGFDRIVDIRALDPLTLRVRLRAAFAPFLTYFFETENYPVLPAHLLRRDPLLVGSPLDAKPIGTGPYRVTSWVHGDSLRLESFGRYFGGAPSIGTLVIQFVPNAQTIVERLRTGEADAYLAADPFVLAQLRSIPALRVETVPIYGILCLSMQTRDAALRDAGTRRTVAHLFDLDRDVAEASHGVLQSKDALAGLFTWAYVPHELWESPATAPPSLTLSIDGTRPLERTLAAVMQQEAHRAGVALSIRPYSPQQFEATASDQGPLADGDFQLALHEILTGADPETSWLLSCDQIPPIGYDVSRYCNASVDRMLADALTTNDRSRRSQDYEAVQDAIARDVPMVALAQLREVEAVPTALSGFGPSLETPYYHVERWRL